MRYYYFFILFFCFPCQALIVGQNTASESDSPTQRIDANSCSSPWAGVVSIEINKGVYSGVILGKSWILTAAHVVDGTFKEPDKIHIYIPCQNIELRPGKVFVHRQYHHDSVQGIALYDLALLKLTQPLPDFITRYNVNFQPITESSIATFVGYGASGNAGSPHLQPSSAHLKRWGQNALDKFLIDAHGLQQVYIYDFDGPDKISNYLGGTTLGNRIETEVAPGDSGSPIFIEAANKQWVVTGINTFRMSFPSDRFNLAPPPPNFGSGGGGILLSNVADWLLRLVPDLQVYSD